MYPLLIKRKKNQKINNPTKPTKENKQLQNQNPNKFPYLERSLHGETLQH